MGAFDISNKATVRGAINSQDKCTIVSIFPLEIIEVKHTIVPGKFVIPPGNLVKPSLTVIGSSSYWLEPHIDQPLIEIQLTSIQVAESIITDYCNGLIGCNMRTKKPGIFYVLGEKSLIDIKKDEVIQARIKNAEELQREWYKELAKMADTLWARTNGNPIVVADLMRLAAQELQLKEKAWMKDFNTLEMSNCPACGTLRNGSFPVCGNCKTILDAKRYAELGLKQAV